MQKSSPLRTLAKNKSARSYLHHIRCAVVYRAGLGLCDRVNGPAKFKFIFQPIRRKTFLRGLLCSIRLCWRVCHFHLFVC